MKESKALKKRLHEVNSEVEFTLEFSCPMNWDDLESTDDERCRHCPKCELPVFDLVGLNAIAIEELIAANGGEVCGNAYIRNDNRLSFEECTSPRKALRGKIRPVFPK